MSKENCPFCNGKERIVKENEHAYALLSNPRKVPGHTLVKEVQTIITSNIVT